MANPNPDISNLVPLNKRTKKAQRKIQSKGGKVSAENKRKTKELIRISSFLHEFIDSQQEDVRVSLKRIVQEGGQPLINLTKVALEATEGSKIHQTGTTKLIISDKKQIKEVVDELWD